MKKSEAKKQPQGLSSNALACKNKHGLRLGTIHILRKQVLGHFLPTHYVSIFYALKISKKAYFLTTPARAYVIYEWSPSARSSNLNNNDFPERFSTAASALASESLVAASEKSQNSLKTSEAVTIYPSRPPPGVHGPRYHSYIT